MSVWKSSKIKASVTDYGDICQKAEKLSGGPPEVMNQEETFYNVEQGFWKLRTNADSTAKLLSYDQQDKNPCMLRKIIVSTSTALDLTADEAKQMGKILMESLGSCGRVVKERKLYKVDDINIYVDIVDGVGKFIKIELVIPEKRKLQYPEGILKEMQKKLEISDDDLVTSAYHMMKGNACTASEHSS